MGGSSKGKGARAPTTAPVSLESAQRLKIVDLVCEGVKDWAHPVSEKDIYLDGTPLQNADGTWNFEGVEVYALPGIEDQEYLPDFETSDTVIVVGAEVKQNQPVTRAVTDPAIDRIRVTVAVGGLEKVTDEGDTVETCVDLQVTAVNGHHRVQQVVTISGRTNAVYHRDVVLENLPPVPFNLTVSRMTPDSQDNRVRDKTQWVSYVESIDAKLNYPNSVVVGLKINSALFGGQVPRRTYRSHWTVVDVPDNYDPDTRTYAGVWNGTFKRAWTNNPAWIYRDLVVNPRYGLAKYRDDIAVDKWALYAIARYCDEPVDDGMGGREPRFTCNAYITEPRDAYDVLSDLASCFRGITYFDGLQQVATQDTPKDPVAIYSNNNVVDGLFEYAGVGYKDIATACIVKFADAKNSFRTDSVEYQDDAAIARFGYNVKTLTAFGCTSRGQAQRVARWVVETSLRERETVQFSVGREGIRHLPYDIIRIADNDYAGAQIGARVVAVRGREVTLDRDVERAQTLHYLDSQGREQRGAVSSTQGAVVTLDNPPQSILVGAPAALSLVDAKPRLFRAVGIAENSDGTYTISAIAHDPQKEAVVDRGAARTQDDPTTRHTRPQVYAPRVESNGHALTLRWDSLASGAVSYQVKIYRNGELYRTFTTTETFADLSNLPAGDYRAEIVAVDVYGGLSEPSVQVWTISYDITALRSSGKVFAIALTWQPPPYIINQAWIELWYSKTDDIATATQLARLPYPTAQYTMESVDIAETWYFWARLVDATGHVGAWTQSVSGQALQDPNPIVKHITGSITESALHQDLADKINRDIDLPPMAGDAEEFAGDNTRYAGVWSLASAVQEGDRALAEKTDLMQAKVDDNVAQVRIASQAVADLKAGTSALYSVSVKATAPDGTPIIGGLAVGVDGQTASSEILMQADKFLLWDGQKRPVFAVSNGKTAINGDLIADGTILGRHIRANQTLSAPQIFGGSLNIGGSAGQFTVNNTGQVSITSPGNAGLEITNERITVRDENGQVRIIIGKLS